jgi:Holliday junction resolvase RusA-like endonuclease
METPVNGESVAKPIRIIIPGRAKSPQQKRHGIGRRKDGKAFLMRYGDDAADEHRNTVKALAFQAMNGRRPIEGPVQMRFRVYVPIPKSMPKYKQAEARAGRLFPCKTPDLDNAMKLCQDGINQTVVVDDKQIVRLTEDSGRFYGQWERIEIEVRQLVHCPYQAAEFATEQEEAA